ncbi:transporter [Pseudomonas arsenicoxydans]|nr:transporter [Pseudomonas arsenicoxydans]
MNQAKFTLGGSVSTMAACALLLQASGTLAQEQSRAELAKKLSNPIADLISMPVQYNHLRGLGPNNADVNVTNIQPVIPIHLDAQTNIISRTIVPIINFDSPAPGVNGQSGIGDVLQSFFYSPVAEADGWVWGVGAAINAPTANKQELGSGKWSAGPTAVVLKQHDGWTYGILANKLNSFAGQSNRDYVDSTFVQPFLTYTTKTYTTFGINTESTYNAHDGATEGWTSPVNLTVAQLAKIAGKPVQFEIGYTKYVTNPTDTPTDGFRVAVTLLMPD